MYQEIKLPNGARLLTEAVPGARSAALGFFVGVGSRHEAPKENGAAHFIEHMLFKGTGLRTAAQLARDMDAIGGQVNAYTTKEHTAFYARCLDSHLDRALDILSDMLFHSRFDQSDVEMERGVILEEIGMYEDTPEDLVSERLNAAVFKGTPLARPILGTRATLSAMTGESLALWHREHYRPGSMVAALTGHFTSAQVDRLVNCLSALEPGPAPDQPAAAYRPAVTAKRKAIEQNHLILAFPALPYLAERRPQMLLLNTLLGAAAPPGCSRRCGRSGACATPSTPTCPTTPTPACWASTPPSTRSRRARRWTRSARWPPTWPNTAPPRRSWSGYGSRPRPTCLWVPSPSSPG